MKYTVSKQLGDDIWFNLPVSCGACAALYVRPLLHPYEEEEFKWNQKTYTDHLSNDCSKENVSVGTYMIKIDAGEAGIISSEPFSITIENNKYCKSDADCVIKQIGCDCCGYKYACLNKDALEGECDFETFTCLCVHEKPKGCQCVDNQCEPTEPYIP